MIRARYARGHALMRGLLVCATLLCPAAPLSAQSPADRRMIDAFRDSLEQVEDTAALRNILARERRATPPGDRELRRLRVGWTLTRLGIVADSGTPLIAAAMEFYEAGIRSKGWPYAWFGLGATKVVLDGMGVREFRSAHQTGGNGWRQGAILAFMDALRADPDFRQAAIEAAKLTLRDDNVAVRPGLPAAIEHAVVLDSTDALGWMLLGRMRRRLGSERAAADAYGVAVRIGGTVRGIASLELARQLAALGRPDTAAMVYYSGASAPDMMGAAAYRKDLEAVATTGDLAAWDTSAATSRPAWLHDFWHHREIVSGRPAGTRLPEHFRRWHLAYKSYRLIPAWTRLYEFGMPYRSGNDELDDRGTIYIRHGEPDQQIPHFGGEAEESAETWVYERMEGRLIFHFKLANALSGVSGWRAVESIAYIGNTHVLPNLIDVDPMYLAIWGGSTGGRVSPRWESERQMIRESLDRGTTTDSDPLRFENLLHPVVQAYGIGGELRGEGRILIVWAIPGEDTPPADTVPGIQGIVYSVRTRINATDSAGKVLLETDSVRRFRAPAPLAAGQSLSGLVTLNVAPGNNDVRIAIMDSAERRGAFRLVEGVPVPAFEGGFEVSDLVLGIEGSGLYWTSDLGRFPLNPRNAWTPQEAIEVGFELEAASPTTPYKVKIAIADLGADSTKPPRASVEFENQASGTRELVTQSLGLQTLRPGKYLLTLTVTVGDRSIRRERRITIVAAR